MKPHGRRQVRAFLTGFVIGGVPPLGHKLAIEIRGDQSLLRFDKVWAAAGTPHTVFAIDQRPLGRNHRPHLIAVCSGRT